MSLVMVPAGLQVVRERSEGGWGGEGKEGERRRGRERSGTHGSKGKRGGGCTSEGGASGGSVGEPESKRVEGEELRVQKVAPSSSFHSCLSPFHQRRVWGS